MAGYSKSNRGNQVMNQKKVGVLLSYGQIIITVLANLLYTPIMLRFLGQSEYGVYSLSNSVIGYFALLYTGMSSTYLRYYSVYNENNDRQAIGKLNGLFLLLFSLIGSVSLIAGLLVAGNLEYILGSGLTEYEFSLAKVLFIIMSFNMALLMPKTVFAAIVIAQEQFIFIKALGICTALFGPLLSILLLYFGFGSIGMSIVALTLTLTDLLVNIWYCRAKLKLPFIFSQLPYKLLPGMAAFSVFIMIQGIMDQFNWHLGKILLSYVADSAAIAVYTIGLQIDLLFSSMAAAFFGVVVPQIYRLVHDGKTDEITYIWIKVGRYQFYVLFFIWAAFLIFGRNFVQLWAGADYDDAYWVAIILITPIVIHLCQVLGMEILRAYNKHAQWVMIHLLFSAAGFIISIPFAMKYGAIGVAVGTGINTFIVTNIYDNWYYYKAGKLDVFKFFKNFAGFLPAAAVTMLTGGFMAYVFNADSWWNFSALIFGFNIIYLLIMYVLAMNNEEKIILKNALRKISCRF